jgi:hypothetical protein
MRTGGKESLGAAVTALLASSTTLVCCVLPAVLVSLGAGAAVVGLITAFPQLIWLSEHKVAVFGIATALLILSGALLRWASRLPCPVDAGLGRRCMQLRRYGLRLYVVSVGLLIISVAIAFVVPNIQN